MAVCKLFRTEWATPNPLGFADLEKILPVANPSQNVLGFVDLGKILPTSDPSQNFSGFADLGKKSTGSRSISVQCSERLPLRTLHSWLKVQNGKGTSRLGMKSQKAEPA